MSREYPCVYYYGNGRCKKFEEPGYIDYCVLGPCQHETPSNADRIRAMSDEELADVVANGVGCVLTAPHCMDVDCTPCILKWLKQPAESEAVK